MRNILFLAPLAVVTVLVFACGGDDSPSPFGGLGGTGLDNPVSIMDRAQQELEAQDGYRIEVGGHNFVLPQWGGIDGGTVEVRNSPAEAEASLQRTGDGLYSMLYTDGQTFFERSTCDHFARVPGGGHETMLPFLWAETDALSRGTAVFSAEAPGGNVTLDAEMAYIGLGQLEIDRETYLPVRFTKLYDPDTQMTWTFSGWDDQPPDVERPEGEVPDQGPGGNPC